MPMNENVAQPIAAQVGKALTALEERQRDFDAKEYFMHDRITGVRYCDIMTPKQFQQMKDNMEQKNDRI